MTNKNGNKNGDGNENESDNQIIQKAYKIPRRYLFEYVSCANYCK